MAMIGNIPYFQTNPGPYGVQIQVCLSMMPFLFVQMSIHLAPGIRSDVEPFGKSTFLCVFL